MPIISFSKADVLKGQLLKPSWYDFEIIKFEMKKPKTGGDTMNYVFTFALTIPGRPVDERPEIAHTINSAAKGNMIPLICALQKKNESQILDAMESGTLDFDPDTSVGSKGKTKLENEPYDGRMVNKLKAFLPEGAPVPF